MSFTTVHNSKNTPAVKLITKSSEAKLSSDIANAIIEELQEMQKKFKVKKLVKRKFHSGAVKNSTERTHFSRRGVENL